jgi:putative transposon-encoded protein
MMRKKTEMVKATELRVTGIEGFFKKKVTKFGTGAKIDCPKEYLGKTVYVIVCQE